MANKKEIQRTERIEFIVSKEEKELIFEFAKKIGMKPSRMIRNIVLTKAEGAMGKFNASVVIAYRKYLELTDPELLKKLSETD